MHSSISFLCQIINRIFSILHQAVYLRPLSTLIRQRPLSLHHPGCRAQIILSRLIVENDIVHSALADDIGNAITKFTKASRCAWVFIGGLQGARFCYWGPSAPLAPTIAFSPLHLEPPMSENDLKLAGTSFETKDNYDFNVVNANENMLLILQLASASRGAEGGPLWTPRFSSSRGAVQRSRGAAAYPGCMVIRALVKPLTSLTEPGLGAPLSSYLEGALHKLIDR